MIEKKRPGQEAYRRRASENWLGHATCCPRGGRRYRSSLLVSEAIVSCAEQLQPAPLCKMSLLSWLHMDVD